MGVAGRRTVVLMGPDGAAGAAELLVPGRR
jgi:hypothetical protein